MEALAMCFWAYQLVADASLDQPWGLATASPEAAICTTTDSHTASRPDADAGAEVKTFAEKQAA